MIPPVLVPRDQVEQLPSPSPGPGLNLGQDHGRVETGEATAVDGEDAITHDAVVSTVDSEVVVVIAGISGQGAADMSPPQGNPSWVGRSRSVWR